MIRDTFRPYGIFLSNNNNNRICLINLPLSEGEVLPAGPLSLAEAHLIIYPATPVVDSYAGPNRKNREIYRLMPKNRHMQLVLNASGVPPWALSVRILPFFKYNSIQLLVPSTEWQIERHLKNNFRISLSLPKIVHSFLSLSIISLYHHFYNCIPLRLSFCLRNEDRSNL